MQPLSAAEAITPAIERTRTVLFRPFRLGRSWKLAATAYLATLGAFFLPTPVLSFLASAGQPHKTPLALLFTAGIGTVFSIVMFVFFYIGTRMEFVLFDVVLLNEKFVAPPWRRHAHHSWRWMGFKVLFSLLIALTCGPLFYLAYGKLLPQLKTSTAPAVPGQLPPHLFHNLIQLYAVIGIPIVFALLLSSLLTNFVLPSIALEDTTVREALRRFLALTSAEPGPVAAFVGFKILLGIAAFIAMEAAIVIAELLCLIPIGLIALAGWLLLRSAGDAGHLLMLAGAVLLLALFAVVVVYGSTIVLGCVHTFFQAYALYFLGGRYPLLGDTLEPPAPLIPYAPPQPPPPLSQPGIVPLPPSEPAT